MKLNPTNTAIIKRLLVGRNSRPLKSILNRVEPPDLASLFMQLAKVDQGHFIEALVSVQKAGSVFEQLPEGHLTDILSQLDDATLARILKHSLIHQASFLLQFMPSQRHSSLLTQLDWEKREKILQFLNYPEDSVGRMMNSYFFSIPQELNAQQSLEYLRQKAREESIYYIYCVGEDQKLKGVVSLRDLATADPQTPLIELTQKEVVTVNPHQLSKEAARLVSHYDFLALPVVNKDNQIIGLITVDDVVDIIEEQARVEIYATAGLQENDRVYSPLREKIKNRTPWMLLNLVLAGLASLVLYQFEKILEELVLLAVTKNIVTSTSGNAAIQSLTVTTRGMAMNDFQFIPHRKVLVRESLVGLTMGFLTGSLAGLAIYVFQKNLMYSFAVGVVMCLSMIMTSVVACLSGAATPMFLKKLGKDPAVGSGVIVTIITDIFGFFSFLSLATFARTYFF